MPNNESALDIERAVLSKMLKSPEHSFQVLGYLKPMHFSVAQHEIIFRVIEELTENNTESTYLILQSRLDSLGLLDKAGGKAYLEELYTLEPGVDDLQPLVDIIIKAYMVRSANIIGYNMMKIDKAEQETIESYLSQVSQQLDDLVVGSSGSSTESIQSIMREGWDELVSQLGSPGIPGVDTGFEELNLLTSGFNPGDLILVAARPSTGKTAFATRITLNMAKRNVPILLFSYEMAKKQLSQRMVASESSIGLQNIKSGALSEKEMDALREVYIDISSYPIYIDSNMSASLGYVLSTIRRFVRSSGVKVVVIDYIQLMTQSSDNETQELGRISRSLKMLAMELGITIVVLSQLNRGLENRENKRPLMSDLRQSGRLEEDADIIIMLYRPAAYGKVKADEENLLELIIRKNRNGPTGIIQTYFESSSVNIVDSLHELVKGKTKSKAA